MTVDVKRGYELLRRLSMVEAVASDLDGTLTKDRRSFIIPLETISAVRELREKGIQVVIVSANGYPILSGLARYIGFDAVIAENGCIIAYKPSPRHRDFVVEEESEANLLGLVKEIVKELGDDVAESWQNIYRKYDFAIVTQNRSPPTKEILDKILRLAERKGYGGRVKISSSGYAIHVTPLECSKASSLEKLLSRLGIGLERVVGIGDSVMDVDFVSRSGVSVAVSNADEELKRVADIITDRESGYGFADLARLILQSKDLYKAQ